MSSTHSMISAKAAFRPPSKASRGDRDWLSLLFRVILALALPSRASRRLAVVASVAVLTLLVGAETRAPGSGSVFVESVVETDASALAAKGARPTESVWNEESWPLEVDFDAIDSDADDDVVSEVLAPPTEPLDLSLLPLAEVAPRTLERAADSSRYALEAGLPRGPPRRV